MATKKKMTEAPVSAKTKSGRSGCQVNLSDDERDCIDRGAALAGLERSAFMRSESIKAARRLLSEVGVPT